MWGRDWIVEYNGNHNEQGQDGGMCDGTMQIFSCAALDCELNYE